MDNLNSRYLFEQANALAGVIGARPAGSRAEQQARQYLCHALSDAGVVQYYEQAIKAPTAPANTLLTTTLLALASNLLPRRLRWLGGLLALYSAHAAYQATLNRRQVGLDVLVNVPQLTSDSANLIARIPAANASRRRVVLLANIDTPRERLTYTTNGKPALRALNTISVIAALLNGVAQLTGNDGLRRLTISALALVAPVAIAEASAQPTTGANDNASGCACLLGLAGELARQPLRHTDVWVVFAGAEDTASAGLHAFLDRYREDLADATFIALERVGAGEVVYCTHHSGLSYLGDYTPDQETLLLAMDTAHTHPELRVHGAGLNTLDLIGGVRARGFKGICITATDGSGWSPQWNQPGDTMAIISPDNLERAARFCRALLAKLDEKN